jgi:hypothetical protein
MEFDMQPTDSDRYETRPWASGDERMVRFQTAPGRLEGEPIMIEYLLSYALDSNEDESIYDSVAERTVAGCFVAPLNRSDLDEHTPELTADEQSVMATSAGAVLLYFESGRVDSHWFDSAEAYDKFVGELRQEYEEEEDIADEMVSRFEQ